MKLLLHTCCAPCSVYCIDKLRGKGIEPTIYWYNPNIHPFIEYKARRDCLKEYTKNINIEAIFEDEYGLDEFCKNVSNDLKGRCTNYCYPIRLIKTFEYAKKNGYDTVSTTLLYSIYQKHDFIKKYMEELSKEYGIDFLYIDFREGFWEGHQKAHDLGLYMQKYCGCIFSEEISNSAHQKKDKEESIRANRDTERKIRLSYFIPNLDFRTLKRDNKEEIGFIYDTKKENYKKYVEEYYQEWNEDIQKKLFEKYMKENAKHIKIITLDEIEIGFFDGKNISDKIFEIGNICLLPQYQNKGIGTAIIKEVLFENKNKEIRLQCFKSNPAIKLYERLGFEKAGEAVKAPFNKEEELNQLTKELNEINVSLNLDKQDKEVLEDEDN